MNPEDSPITYETGSGSVTLEYMTTVEDGQIWFDTTNGIKDHYPYYVHCDVYKGWTHPIDDSEWQFIPSTIQQWIQNHYELCRQS